MKKINAGFKKIILPVKVFLIQNKIYLLAVSSLGLLIDIFLNSQFLDFVFLILIVLWVINLYNFRLRPSQTLILAMSCYLVSFLTQYFNLAVIVEKGASWFFIFLLIALGQSLLEEFWQKK